MVLPFKRDRRSLLSDRSILQKLAPSKIVRSARTPPSTFLFLLFSFQTARSRSATFTRYFRPWNLQTHPTTIRNRRLVGCQFTHLNEELQRRKRAPVPTAMAAPRQWMGLYARPSTLVNVRVNKLSQVRPRAVITRDRADF